MGRTNTKVHHGPLSEKFISLMDSKRGLAAKMAKAIGKPNSYFSEIRRGNPVNAQHIRAVGIVLGQRAVIDLLDINDIIARDNLGDLQEPIKSPPGSTIYPGDTEGQRLTVLREATPGRLTHEDLIARFENKKLALELNQMLLQIEAADPEILRGYVRGFLQGILTGLKSKKNGTEC